MRHVPHLESYLARDLRRELEVVRLANADADIRFRHDATLGWKVGAILGDTSPGQHAGTVRQAHVDARPVVRDVHDTKAIRHTTFQRWHRHGRVSASNIDAASVAARRHHEHAIAVGIPALARRQHDNSTGETAGLLSYLIGVRV